MNCTRFLRLSRHVEEHFSKIFTPNGYLAVRNMTSLPHQFFQPGFSRHLPCCYPSLAPSSVRNLGTSANLLKRRNSFRNEDEEEDTDEQEETDDEDSELDEALEETAATLRLHPKLRNPFLDLAVGHKVLVVQPKFKWGPKKPQLTTPELQLAESVALIDTLDGWEVVDSCICSLVKPNKKYVYGSGTFASLGEKIRSRPEIDAVFLSLELLTSLQICTLEEAWGVKVYDRYTVVLQIFKQHATTGEAKLQIALGEIPYLRIQMRGMLAGLDQQGGGQRYIGGSGETMLEVQQRVLGDKERKIRRALDRLHAKRGALRHHRSKKQFPVVSVVGYTNSGKTTLIRSLTGDQSMEPRDQLFATLDVTAHPGLLPNRLAVLYMDTIGFISDLPHSLIQSFTATLQDLIHSDVIVHIRDISHPDAAAQKEKVLVTLDSLGVPPRLLDNMIEVCNKVDLVDHSPDAGKEEDEDEDEEALRISALLGMGLAPLQRRIQRAVLASTDYLTLTLTVPMEGPHLNWLYRNCTVKSCTSICQAQGVNTNDDVNDNSRHSLDVQVIISQSKLAIFNHRFQHTRSTTG